MTGVRFYFWLLSFWGLTFSSGVHAQEILQKPVVLHDLSDKTVGDVMDEIAEENGFYFSYQSSTLDLEARAPVSSFSGNMAAFLHQVFGDSYEFREFNDYLIIRHAPGKLDLEMDTENQGNQWLVKGKIMDLGKQEPVANASIYEKIHLVSALSDEQGNFELKFKTQSPTSIWLTLSKASYRDTTFVVLPSVEVATRNFAKGRFRFFPDNGKTENLEESFLGRMFIGFRQRMQRLNLAGYFLESPVQFSLLPGLSSKGLLSSQLIPNFSLNLIGGYTGGVEGLEVSGLFSMNQMDVKGVQVAGGANLLGGGVSGFQAAGLFNKVQGGMQGFQVAGLGNQVIKEADGVQIAGLYNRSGGPAQLQIAGLFNQAMQVESSQVSGLSNPGNAGKLQVAGLSNVAGGEVDYQIGGLVNKAEKVSGIQVAGLLNIAEESDYPIGLINIIENGQQSLSLGMDETSFARLTFRSGGRKMYGLIAPGVLLQSPRRYGLEMGLGMHILQKRHYSMDLEVVHRFLPDFPFRSTALRFLQGIQPGKHLKFFAGTTLGLRISDSSGNAVPQGLPLGKRFGTNDRYGLHAGLTVGIQWVF